PDPLPSFNLGATVWKADAYYIRSTPIPDGVQHRGCHLMTNMLSTPKRKWIAASAMAMIVAAGTLGVGFVQTQPAYAQVGTEISPPMNGFADLVESVSPAVVSVQVSSEVPLQQVRRGPNFQF